MPGIVIFLIAISIVLIQPDGFGVGMSVFALIGALMLLLRQ